MLKNDSSYYPPNHSDEKFNLIIYIFSRIAKEYIRTHGFSDMVLLALGNGTSTEAVASEFKNLSPLSEIYSYYPSFDKNQIVFGLLAPNLHLKHVKPALSLTNHVVFTNDLSLDIINFLPEIPEISQMGLTTQYGLSLAQKLAEMTSNKNYFCIAYDRIERYLD